MYGESEGVCILRFSSGSVISLSAVVAAAAASADRTCLRCRAAAEGGNVESFPRNAQDLKAVHYGGTSSSADAVR